MRVDQVKLDAGPCETQATRVRYVIANRFDGLGGRLVSLMLAGCLANRLAARLLVHWPDNRDLAGESLAYLFDDTISRPYRRNGRGDLVDWPRIFKTEEITSLRLVGPKDRLEAGDLQRFDAIALRSTDFKSISAIEGLSEDAIRRGCARAFSRLRLHPEIVRKLAGFSAGDLLPGAVGIHVRHGDLETHKKLLHRERCLASGVFHQALEAYPDRYLFLASDDRSVMREFRRRYGDRLLTLPSGLIHPGFSRSSKRALQHAFVEILLLARCERILAAPSNFSRAAVLIGENEYVVLHSDNKAPEWSEVKGNWGL